MAGNTLTSIQFTLAVILLYNCVNIGLTSPNIVIIGAGIGGASCAYYLREWIPQANITILEADDRIGGRIEETTIEGVTVEIGADAWATSNRYISELARKLKLPIESDYSQKRRKKSKELFSGDSLMIWDGRTLTSASDIAINATSSVAETLVVVGEFLARLELNYVERDVGNTPFRDLPQYLTSGGTLQEYVNMTSREFFKKHAVTDFLQLFGIEPILRVIYGQGLAAHSFAGLVSLTSGVEPSSSVNGGNARLPKALIKASKADVQLNSPVISISKEVHGLGVTFNKLNRSQQLLTDVVILAAPLEWTDISFHNFANDPLSKQPHRTWTYWYVHHVSAKSLNNKYFNQPENWKQPQDILTTSNASTPWATIQFVSNNNGLNIYKLFCFENITSTINQYFLGIKTVHIKYWKYTFPGLMPIQKKSQFQDIKLDNNLFNINSMESVASAMEGSVISARNVAMIVKKNFRK